MEYLVVCSATYLNILRLLRLVKLLERIPCHRHQQQGTRASLPLEMGPHSMTSSACSSFAPSLTFPSLWFVVSVDACT